MRIVIKKPIITEKTMKLAEENNQYTFEVAMSADKDVARKQIENLYGVDVLEVTSHTRLGKVKRISAKSNRTARRQNRKFMVFKLKDNQKIEVFEQ